MEPTVEVLVKCGIAPTQARDFSPSLIYACGRFQIDTPVRIAAFIAQCNVESAGFTRLEENLYYTTPERIKAVWPKRIDSLNDASLLCRNPRLLANIVYANRLGNGDAVSGDGWKYRGRGLKQLTGKNNYSDAQTELDRPFLENPDLVAGPVDACLTAAWFWSTIKGNLLADSSQIDALTRAINGPAMLLADTRRSLFDDSIRALA